MKHETFALFLALLPNALASAQTPVVSEEAGSTTMTWEQLVARPELWPRQCRVSVEYKYEADTIDLAATYVVVFLDAENVEVVLPSGATGNVPVASTDALAVANAAYAQMSPEQRALDMKTIMARADLWPDKVTLQKTVTTTFGGEACKYPQGSELSFGFVDATHVKARHPGFAWTPQMPIHNTDLVERIRATLTTKRGPAAHRVLQEIEGKVVSLRTGKKARVNPKSPPDYVVLYFSAGWCGPCHAFSPSLVSFYEQHKKQVGKRFEIIWISRDHSAAEMDAYAKELKFAWLAIPWEKLEEIPMTKAYGPSGIPDLVVLDAKGAVVASSYRGSVYLGAESALKVLTERLNTSR